MLEAEPRVALEAGPWALEAEPRVALEVGPWALKAEPWARESDLPVMDVELETPKLCSRLMGKVRLWHRRVPVERSDHLDYLQLIRSLL